MSSVVTGWRIEAYALHVAIKNAEMMAKHGMCLVRGLTVKRQCETWGVKARTWEGLAAALSERLTQIEAGRMELGVEEGSWIMGRLISRGWIAEDGALVRPDGL